MEILIAYRLGSDRVFEGMGARHDISGQLDREFGTNGRTLIDIQLSPPAAEAPPEEERAIGGSGGSASGIQALPDGKILFIQILLLQLPEIDRADSPARQKRRS